jgi:hypothetical protein
MGKKRFWLDEDFARALQGLLGRDALAADAMTDANLSSSQTREIITCVLHENINDTISRVVCTRLAIIPDRGTKRAWQVVTDPLSGTPFKLTINGTEIGPFTAATTTTAFQAALNAITSPAIPIGHVIHGNFFVYPTSTLAVTSGTSIATAYEVPWFPLVGDADQTTVGSRRLAKTGEFKRGSTQAAEFIHGYGFAIASAPAVAEVVPTTPTECPCVCIENGDAVVNGITTTSVWTVAMKQEKFKSGYGTILFPAGTYDIVLNDAGDKWELDIGDVLTATYNDGSSATADTTMDGALTMEWGAYGPVVKLCVDGLVPEPEA